MGKLIDFLIAVFIISFIMAIPIMIFWNAVIPNVFGLKEVSLWQAFCLNTLCGLFKSSISLSSDKEFK